MRIRTKITAALIAAACLTSAAAAESSFETGVADDGIRARIMGTIDMHDFGYSDAQLKERIPYLPLQIGIAVSDPDTGEALYTNQIQPDDTGAYTVDFLLNNENGTYNLKIYTPYCKVYDGTIDYADGTVGMFNSLAASGDAKSLEEYMYQYSGCMGLDLLKYKQLSEKERGGVLTDVMSKAPFSLKSDINNNIEAAVFDAGLISETMTAEEKNKMFCEYLDALGEDYADITAFVKLNNLSSPSITLYNAGEYDSVESGIYEIALTAYLENNIKNIYDLEVLFTDNLFSVSDAAMARYNKCANKTDFFTALNKKIGGVNTLDDFYTAVDSALSDAEKIGSVYIPAPGYSSGGGGGGGSRATSYTSPIIKAAETPKPAETPTPEEATEKKEIFSDMTDYEWAEEAVRELARLGVVKGDGSGKFLPERSITREEFAQIISGAFKLLSSDDTGIGFTDVNESDWYYEAVMKCAENSITMGISETEFGIGKNITRQEAAAMIARAMGLGATQGNAELFADDEAISDYARSCAYALRERGILDGYDDGTFGPGLLLSRAEAAKMIFKAIQFGGE